jgi:hypothetical protein
VTALNDIRVIEGLWSSLSLYLSKNGGEGLFEGTGERDAGFRLIGLFVSFGRLAAQVLVTALAVPVGLHTEEPDELKGKNSKLTALLGLTHNDAVIFFLPSPFLLCQ